MKWSDTFYIPFVDTDASGILSPASALRLMEESGNNQIKSSHPNWDELAERLHKCGYTDILTFELNNKSKPNRHENDKYWNMPIEEYIAECYVRACRFANALVKKENNG